MASIFLATSNVSVVATVASRSPESVTECSPGTMSGMLNLPCSSVSVCCPVSSATRTLGKGALVARSRTTPAKSPVVFLTIFSWNVKT